jgi:hypothetical protein
MLGFFSSRLNRDPPTPLPTGECVPPFKFRGAHLLVGERVGGGVPIRKGQTLWCKMEKEDLEYIYSII